MSKLRCTEARGVCEKIPKSMFFQCPDARGVEIASCRVTAVLLAASFRQQRSYDEESQRQSTCNITRAGVPSKSIDELVAEALSYDLPGTIRKGDHVGASTARCIRFTDTRSSWFRGQERNPESRLRLDQSHLRKRRGNELALRRRVTQRVPRTRAEELVGGRSRGPTHISSPSVSLLEACPPSDAHFPSSLPTIGASRISLTGPPP